MPPGAVVTWQPADGHEPDPWLVAAADLFCAFRRPPSPDAMLARMSSFLATSTVDIDDDILRELIRVYIHSVCYSDFIDWLSGSPLYRHHLHESPKALAAPQIVFCIADPTLSA